MDSKIIPIFAPVVSSFATWLFTHLYHRKEKKNDLENKLTVRIEELTQRILELNQKLLDNVQEINAIKLENIELKRQIMLLKQKNCKP
jgi:cell division protein FtsB